MHASEMEGLQAQLRYAQLRVQSLEQEMKSVKQELDQKVRSVSAWLILFDCICLEKREHGIDKYLWWTTGN